MIPNETLISLFKNSDYISEYQTFIFIQNKIIENYSFV
jgi:hypothetical protein